MGVPQVYCGTLTNYHHEDEEFFPDPEHCGHFIFSTLDVFPVPLHVEQRR